MYAIDDLSDAIDVTRNFLTPVTAGKWLRLALVVFFVGGAGGSGVTNFSTSPGGFDGGTAPADGPPVTDEWILFAVAVIAVVAIVGLVWLAISSLMEFVLVNSLGEGEVHIRRYGKANLNNGLQLFLFQVALGLGILLLVGLPAVGSYLVFGFEGVGLALVGLFALLGVGLFIAYSIITTLTINFVVPIMIMEPRGIIDAWKRFWPTLRTEWKEYVVYYLLAWVLRLVVGFGIGIVTLILFLIVGIPFGILVFVLFLIPVLGWILAALLVFVGILFFVLISALVQVPVESYFRYYALLVLGDTDDRFDLIPDQRAAVRADGGTDDVAEWADDEWGGDGGDESAATDRDDTDEDDTHW